jgi:hypothetical protein
MNALRVAVIVLIAASAHARPLDRPPSAAQLRQWMGDGCVSAGKRVGIDYTRSLDSAIRGDAAGLRSLFHFTISRAFVGAAAESHCSIMLGLLQRWGDPHFAHALRTEQPRVRKAVIDAIDYAFPYPGWHASEFPATYTLAPHEHTPKA